MILNEGNHLNNTPSHKSIYADTETKSSDRNNSVDHKSQNEGGTNNRKSTLIIGDSVVENVEGWRLNKTMKSTVAIK